MIFGDLNIERHEKMGMRFAQNRRTDRRMSERRTMLAWVIPSEKEEDEIKQVQSQTRLSFAMQGGGRQSQILENLSKIY